MRSLLPLNNIKNMYFKTIYVIADNPFGKLIAEWSANNGIEVISTKKDNHLDEKIDGVVHFHTDHDFVKEDEEIREFLIKNHKIDHKVDLNGTKIATLSNFEIWVARNRPKNILFLGDKELVKNERLFSFLEDIGFLEEVGK